MNIDKALTWHKLYTVLCNRFNVAQLRITVTQNKDG